MRAKPSHRAKHRQQASAAVGYRGVAVGAVYHPSLVYHVLSRLLRVLYRLHHSHQWNVAACSAVRHEITANEFSKVY